MQTINVRVFENSTLSTCSHNEFKGFLGEFSSLLMKELSNKFIAKRSCLKNIDSMNDTSYGNKDVIFYPRYQREGNEILSTPVYWDRLLVGSGYDFFDENRYFFTQGISIEVWIFYIAWIFIVSQIILLMNRKKNKEKEIGHLQKMVKYFWKVAFAAFLLKHHHFKQLPCKILIYSLSIFTYFLKIAFIISMVNRIILVKMSREYVDIQNIREFANINVPEFIYTFRTNLLNGYNLVPIPKLCNSKFSLSNSKLYIIPSTCIHKDDLESCKFVFNSFYFSKQIPVSIIYRGISEELARDINEAILKIQLKNAYSQLISKYFHIREDCQPTNFSDHNSFGYYLIFIIAASIPLSFYISNYIASRFMKFEKISQKLISKESSNKRVAQDEKEKCNKKLQEAMERMVLSHNYKHRELIEQLESLAYSKCEAIDKLTHELKEFHKTEINNSNL